MKIAGIIKVAFKNIISNKLRSTLTILGLIIGIASVIVLVGIGSGSSNQVRSQVQSLGTDVLTISISSSDVSMEYEDIDDILKIENVIGVTPYKNVSATVSRNETTSQKSSIVLTNNQYLTIMNLSIRKGRELSPIDIENNSKVCILGSEIASTLFGLTDPIGEVIKLDGDNYTVIAVLEEQGTTMGSNVDNIILLPVTTAKYLGSNTSITSLYAKVSNEESIDTTKTQIEDYIRSKLQISSDYYSVSTQDSMLSAMEDINSTLSLLLGGIASISLIVGGIGVMNVMLVSVSERTKEIGIRKSLGARKLDILIQFLIEALVLSILGGLLGVAFGLLIGNIAEKIGYTFVESTWVILVAFSSSALIGLIFGIFPAYRAACLKPIDALREE